MGGAEQDEVEGEDQQRHMKRADAVLKQLAAHDDEHQNKKNISKI